MSDLAHGIVRTPIGRFRRVNRDKSVPYYEAWTFECPGCGQWAYLDDDQWQGRVSVDHAAEFCKGSYHETHPYLTYLGEEILSLLTDASLLAEHPQP